MPSPASTSTSPQDRPLRCSGRAAAESRPCSARSRACRRSTTARSPSTRAPSTGVPPHRRGVGLMFQDDALFPHRDVAANVGFGLRMQSVPRPEREARVRRAAGPRRARGPRAASGVAHSRAASASGSPSPAPSPRLRALLLLDEPLGALDRPLHDRLVVELRALFAEIGQTALYVTHDVAEAFTVGALVAVMRDGRIVQIATPELLWAAPADAWVARFIGLQNVEERGPTAPRDQARGSRLPPRPARRRRRRHGPARRAARHAPGDASTTGARSSPPTRGSTCLHPARGSPSRSTAAAVVEVPAALPPGAAS